MKIRKLNLPGGAVGGVVVLVSLDLVKSSIYRFSSKSSINSLFSKLELILVKLFLLKSSSLKILNFLFSLLEFTYCLACLME